MHYSEVKKYCKNCEKLLILRNNRDIITKNFCSHKCCSNFYLKNKHTSDPSFTLKIVSACNTTNANKKKGHKGKNHPMWISDRTKLKAKRCYKEEKDFMKQILQERNYTCELTGKIGGRLSVHHKNSYKDFPNLRFDRQNVIVIQKDIHRLFHNKYGTMNITEDKWNTFVKTKEYYAIAQ
jgi:hypothetical protein